MTPFHSNILAFLLSYFVVSQSIGPENCNSVTIGREARQTIPLEPEYYTIDPKNLEFEVDIPVACPSNRYTYTGAKVTACDSGEAPDTYLVSDHTVQVFAKTFVPTRILVYIAVYCEPRH